MKPMMKNLIINLLLYVDLPEQFMLQNVIRCECDSSLIFEVLLFFSFEYYLYLSSVFCELSESALEYCNNKL